MIDYLSYNAVELVIVGIAFCFSKSKLLPGMIVTHIIVMTVIFGMNGDYLTLIQNMGVSWSYYNKELAFVYLYEGVVMLAMSFVILATVSKLSALTAMLVLSQSLFSLIMAAYSYAYSVEIVDFYDEVLDLHYSSQSLFVILYCVIAWICVYYSRMREHER